MLGSDKRRPVDQGVAFGKVSWKVCLARSQLQNSHPYTRHKGYILSLEHCPAHSQNTGSLTSIQTLLILLLLDVAPIGNIAPTTSLFLIGSS